MIKTRHYSIARHSLVYYKTRKYRTSKKNSRGEANTAAIRNKNLFQKVFIL